MHEACAMRRKRKMRKDRDIMTMGAQLQVEVEQPMRFPEFAIFYHCSVENSRAGRMTSNRAPKARHEGVMLLKKT